MMGPSLTFDKSFLEMINPEEMDELDLNFSIFVTPTLVSEIIADLKHPAPPAKENFRLISSRRLHAKW